MRFPWRYPTSFLLVAASALCLALPTHAGDVPSLERMKKKYRRPPHSVSRRQSLFGRKASVLASSSFSTAAVREQQHLLRHLP